MGHWYKFRLPNHLGLAVVKAKRKNQVEAALGVEVQFLGCVAAEKIGELRRDPWHVVFNSPTTMRAALSTFCPELLKPPESAQSIACAPPQLD